MRATSPPAAPVASTAPAGQLTDREFREYRLAVLKNVQRDLDALSKRYRLDMPELTNVLVPAKRSLRNMVWATLRPDPHAVDSDKRRKSHLRVVKPDASKPDARTPRQPDAGNERRG
jgi:hypothetical protein